MRWSRGKAGDEAFLHLVDRFERQLAKVLSLILCIVLLAAAVQFVGAVIQQFIDPNTGWLGDDLIRLLGDLLTLLIALEVLQNVTAYLRHHVVQIELVLITALTAVARKVIVLPPGSEDKPMLLVGLGLAVLSLSGGYWLVRRAEITTLNASATPARAFPEQDP
ncbi:phosphate-starvation-inducible PsiE family protein [Synechococcus sp. Lug-A]|uniref:phosphate-starvation-inducible PsiE family protein n=1 Tax=Synechococcus sp. Lug-A TaxID=2823740 RepID=UPI0020CE8941|nr:phosphate-starvation-inducible PsiE family protein [Synechococcus sp. Lug-A]MCP9845770.1 phosphate-starvation-inducible PsiE family protein [Synechococcus sp. Lug-A]